MYLLTSIFQVDMHTVTSNELFGWSRDLVISEASNETPISNLVGWFDVQFCAGDAPLPLCQRFDLLLMRSSLCWSLAHSWQVLMDEELALASSLVPPPVLYQRIGLTQQSLCVHL